MKKANSKTCKNFCRKVFLPERERVEIEFAKRSGLKYEPIKTLRKTDKKLANMLEKLYLNGCNQVYCQKKCGKNKWLPSFSKKRKARLENQGALSGCRDLIKEFPNDYKNI